MFEDKEGGGLAGQERARATREPEQAGEPRCGLPALLRPLQSRACSQQRLGLGIRDMLS